MPARSGSMSPELLMLVAERFRALAEPARLQILDQLRRGERTVGELTDATSLAQANVSKHLQVLFDAGFVSRRKEGLFVRYWLAHRDVVRLCDLVCGRLEAEADSRRRALAAR